MDRQDAPPRESERSSSLTQEPSDHRGLIWVSTAGVVWGGLSWLLASRGHAPSRIWLPIAPDRYYLAQALFVLPLLWLQWRLCVRVSHGIARRLGGTGTLKAAANALGVALAGPLIALLLLPDLLAFLLFGFSALGPLIRVSAPVAALATLGLATAALQRSHGLPRVKALLAASAGVLAQSLLGAGLLR